MAKKVLIIILSIVGISALVFGGYFAFQKYLVKKPQPSQIEKKTYQLQSLRKIKVADGYYPGIIFANDRFYISYFPGPPDKVVRIKTYDGDFNSIDEDQIQGARADYQMAYGNGSFYLFDPQYLRKFDQNWQQLKSVPIFDHLPADLIQRWPHGIDDMLLYLKDGTLYLGMAYGNILPGSEAMKEKKEKPDIPDNLYLQEYDTDLNFQKDAMLKDVGNAPGSAMISQNEAFIIVTGDKHWNDSSLMMIKYDQNWQQLEKKVISATANANEEFPMGLLFDGNHFFLGYHYITGDLFQPREQKISQRTDIMLKAFDQNWNLLAETKVTDDISAKNLTSTAGRPHLALVEDKIYLAYDANGEVIVKEYQLRKTPQ